MTDPLIQIPFRGGPNESTDDRALQPGEVVSLLNVSYDADGQYQPRLGYTSLATPARVQRLFVDGSELLLSDGHTLSSLNPGASAFVAKDFIPEYAVTHGALVNSSGTFSSFAETYGAGYRIATWVDPSDGFIRASVFDGTTGACVLGPTLVSTGTWINVVVGVVGTTAIIVASSNSPSIAAFTLALSPLGTWSAGSVISDGTFLVTSGVFAAAFLSATFVLAYQNGANGAAQTLTLKVYNSSLVQQASGNTVSSGLTGPFNTIATAAVTGGDGFVGVTSSGGTTGNAMIEYDPVALTSTLLGSMSAPTNINQTTTQMSGNARSASVCLTSNTTAVWAIEAVAPAIAWSMWSASAQVGVTMGAVGVGLASGLFFTASQQFATTIVFLRVLAAGAGTALPLLGTFILADLQTATTSALIAPRWLATLAPNYAQNSSFPTSPIPPVINPGPTGVLECALSIMRTTQGRQGLDLFVLTPAMPSPAFVGKELYLNGSYYDGVTLVEDGFASPPQITVGVNAAGNGQFQYCATWARIDSQGNLEESAPSAIFSVASTNTPNVQITAVALHATNKQRTNTTSFGVTVGSGSNVFMVVYRTQNVANGDTTFYRATNDPFPANCKNTQLGANVIYTDNTLADTSLSDGSHPVLYTTSGELPHNAPESMVSIVSHNDRIWGIGADRRTVWFSQTYVDGVIPSWTILQSFTVDDSNEPLVSLASLYDKLLIFTRSRVYVVYGDGPSIAGTNSDLQPPQVIPSATGCIEPRSVVTTPLGTLYLSTRGLELIDNGLSPTFIGQPVSVTTKTFPTCTSAVLSGQTSTVRFTFVSSEAYPLAGGAVGRSVVYDLRRNLWTVHSLGGGADTPVECAASHPIYGYVVGRNTPGSAAADVSRESTTADAAPWLDGTTPQTMSVTTSWVKSGDLQGWAKIRRVLLLAKFYDTHALNVSFSYNYAVAGETHSYPANVLANVVTGNLEQVRMIPVAGRCEAIQATIAVTAAANTSGRACGLTGLAFEIHQVKGPMRDIPVAGKS